MEHRVQNHYFVVAAMGEGYNRKLFVALNTKRLFQVVPQDQLRLELTEEDMQFFRYCRGMINSKCEQYAKDKSDKALATQGLFMMSNDARREERV